MRAPTLAELHEIFGCICEAELGQALAIRFADQLVSALHQSLAFLEALELIDQLFAGIGVITEDGLLESTAAARRRK
jgi:hypothetical protein